MKIPKSNLYSLLAIVFLVLAFVMPLFGLVAVYFIYKAIVNLKGSMHTHHTNERIKAERYLQHKYAKKWRWWM